MNELATQKRLEDGHMSCSLLKVTESLSESTSQGCFQTYIVFLMYYIRHQHVTILQICSAMCSLASIALGLTDLIKYASNTFPVKRQLKSKHLAISCLFFFIDIALRISTIGIFLAQLEFRPYSFIALGALCFLYFVEMAYMICVGEKDMPCGIAVFFVSVGTIKTFSANIPSLFNAIAPSISEKTKVRRRAGFMWIQRGLEFALLGGLSVWNRWTVAEKPPFKIAACLGTLYLFWLGLSVHIWMDARLGYAHLDD